MKLLTAPIDQSGAATTELVAAPGAGKRIVVKGYAFTLASGTAILKSASTALTGAMTTGVPCLVPLACAANEALNIVTSAAAAEGHLAYVIEKV